MSEADYPDPERDDFFSDLTVVWRPRDELTPNEYNPNYMDRHKHEELLRSILHNGWTQPIVVNEETGQIIDGEQRYTVAGWYPGAEDYPSFPDGLTPIRDHEGLVPTTDDVSVEGAPLVKEGLDDEPEVRDVPPGYVPTVEIVKDEVGQKISTIQHNRASGEHGIDDVSDILADVMDEGEHELDWAADTLGMEDEEIDRLISRTPATAAGVDDTEEFSPTWDPETESSDDAETSDEGTSATDAAKDRSSDGEGTGTTGEDGDTPASSGDSGSQEELVRRVYVMSEDEAELVDAALGEDAPANVLVTLCSYALDMGWVPDQREFENAMAQEALEDGEEGEEAGAD